MKILSNYKDYYDYLIGIYGEDPLIVLDRRKHKQPFWEIPSQNQWNKFVITKYCLVIGNYYIEVLRYGYDFYYGKNIFNIPILKESEFGYHDNKRKEDFLCYKEINSKVGRQYILKTPIKIERPKEIENLIIVLFQKGYSHNIYNLCPYPILKDINLNKFVQPEEIYQWIYDYISEQNSKKEIHIDLRTDVQKLEGKGFDKKISFRNIK